MCRFEDGEKVKCNRAVRRVTAEVAEMVLLELDDTPRVCTVLSSAGERMRVEVKAEPTTNDGEVVV